LVPGAPREGSLGRMRQGFAAAIALWEERTILLRQAIEEIALANLNRTLFIRGSSNIGS
jgi:hypothetical protein